MKSPTDRIQQALQKPTPPKPTIQPHHPIPFVLASTSLGPMIVSRLDYRQVSPTSAYGVGFQLLETGTYDQPEIDILTKILDLKRKHSQHVVFVDCGANIGVHTITQAKHLEGWGSVVAIEAQERAFYALAGNVALNNCFNVRCLHAAVTDKPGILDIPVMNYLVPASYGSLELRRNIRQDTGQAVDYARTVEVQAITLDRLNLPRADVIKIDVEGMEQEVLSGAAALILACKPVLLVEYVKSNQQDLEQWLRAKDYEVWVFGMNYVAVHKDDPIKDDLRLGTA